MTATYLVFGSFLIVLFFMVGLFIGWSAREYMMNYQEGPKQIAYHPEFYNKNGDLIEQEIVSVRFEPGYFEDDDEDDDE